MDKQGIKNILSAYALAFIAIAYSTMTTELEGNTVTFMQKMNWQEKGLGTFQAVFLITFSLFFFLMFLIEKSRPKKDAD